MPQRTSTPAAAKATLPAVPPADDAAPTTPDSTTPPADPTAADIPTADQPETTPVADERVSTCVVDDGKGMHVGNAVNGKVCSYHAMHYDREGNRR